MDLVELRSVSKSYPSTATLAVDRADFVVRSGEVHALVGENGAGKSTLAKLLCGFEAPDGGSILVRGRPTRFSSHRDAERAGIAYVAQHSALALGLSAAENVALGHEPRRLGFFTDGRRASDDFAVLAGRYGFDLDPDVPVGLLGEARRREVEILRALSRGGDVLVLDEPTSILGEGETRALMAIVERLKAAGVGIVYISHRAREVRALADRVTVMRDGRVERSLAAHGLDDAGLGELMVAMDARPAGRKAARAPGEPVLTLSGVSMKGASPAESLEGIDLVVRAGEILGVVALGGNGLSSLEDTATGFARPDSGAVAALGKDLRELPRRELRERLMAYLPTDREGRAVVESESVALNAVARRLASYGPVSFAFRRGPAADAGRLLSSVKAWAQRSLSTLSGGNRQRVVASRELDGYSPIVVAANPTQGLDPGSRNLVLSRLADARDAGSGVLLLCSDPDDIVDVADRAYGLYRGRLVPIDPADPGSLSSAITGASA